MFDFSENNIKDFGIVAIKPDGVKSGIHNICEEEFKKREFKIIAFKRAQLKPDDIKHFFYYQYKEYVDYMCSSEVYAYLLQGSKIDVGDAIHQIKTYIRSIYGLGRSDMMNLIHGAQSGTEYYLQRRLFFPEFCHPQYTSYADMCSSDRILGDCQKSKLYLLRDSNVRRIVISTDLPKFNEIAEKIDALKIDNIKIYYSFYDYVEIKGYRCQIVCFCPYSFRLKERYDRLFTGNIDDLKRFAELPCILALGAVCGYYTDFSNKLCSRFEYAHTINESIQSELKAIIDEMKKIKLDAILTESPEMSLWEMEARYVTAYNYNILSYGGSIKEEFFGSFGTAKSNYDKFSSIIGWE